MVLRLAQLSLVYTQERHGHHILVIHIGVALILNGLLVVGGGSRIGHLLLAVVVQDQELTHHMGNDNQQCHQNADHHPGALGQPMVPVMMMMVMVVPTVLAVTAVAMAVAMVMVMMMVVFLTAGRRFHRRACGLRPLAVVLRGVVLAGGCSSRSLFHFKLRRAVTYAGGIIAAG